MGGVTCDVEFNNISQVMGIVYWITLTNFIVNCSTIFTWDPKKYAFYRDKAMFIPQRLLYCFITGWVILNGWSAWRVWYCGNWDHRPFPLIIYVIKMMVIGFVSPAFMLTLHMWVPLAVSLVALGLAVANCIIFFIHDEWAGVSGVLDVLFLVTLAAIFFWIQYYQSDYLKEWIGVKDDPSAFEYHQFSKRDFEESDSSDEDQKPVEKPKVTFDLPENEEVFKQSRRSSPYMTKRGNSPKTKEKPKHQGLTSWLTIN